MMNKQQGSALILSLLILLIMTLLGITSLSTATLEEKMAANDRNQKTVMQHSELALKAAEKTLATQNWGNIENAIANNDPGYYSTADAQRDYYNSTTWQDGTTCIEQSLGEDVDTCYIVEHVYDPPTLISNTYGGISQANLGNKIIRVTARATDASGLTSAMVQSHLNKTYSP